MSSNKKKGNKQSKNNKQEDAAAATATATPPRELTPQEAAIIEMLKKSSLQSASPVTVEQQQQEEAHHKFWDTQPMMTQKDESLPEGPVQAAKSKEDLRATPYNMPKGYEWSNVDITQETQRQELYDLLANNYVEDDDCLFRFDYSKEFLMWALTPPGWTCDLLLGVRSSSNQKLVAFISGVPATIRPHTTTVPMVEINFLCVHKKLRSKRLAPVLIKEITRRVNHTGVFQAVYTAGVVLPVPVASARYHHRSLNPKKLVDVGFSRLAPRMTMARLQKLYKLPTTIVHQGTLVKMTVDDVPGVHALLTSYLSKFKLTVQFTLEEIHHWLVPRSGVIDTYVIRNPTDPTKVTDMCSFYHLPSTILNRHDTLYAAYSFYNVATTIPLLQLMKDCLILAKHGDAGLGLNNNDTNDTAALTQEQQPGADVFNALNLMDNDEFLSDLKFGLGDGNLQYYLYNWNCKPMESKDIGIVLL
mmetsp:Transcript_18645/g.26307  ORF Transcript_18645/g.26307 Transcript_18645/m.26307 type:complete len:473 (-) Transcript_18645:86-1504(-)